MNALQHPPKRRGRPALTTLLGQFTGLAFAACVLIASAGQALAAGSLFTVEGRAGVAGRTSIQLDPNVSRSLTPGTTIDVPLPSGQVVAGNVIREIRSRPAGVSLFADGLDARFTSSKAISLGSRFGGAELHYIDGAIAGMTVFDAIDKTLYTAVIDGNGRGILEKADLDRYLCSSMPVAPPDAAAPPRSPLADAPTLAQVQNLESKPFASRTLYIDYWGGTVSGTSWNDTFNGGADIVYTPYSLDADSTNFSPDDIYTMYLAWLEVAEDYADFDVNVTTKSAVYATAPVNRRSRIIATDTNYFYTGAGGVAYVGVFGFPTDYYLTGWAWNSSAGSLGMTISHEAGHQMGLGHDGTATLGYYGGHGQWGPIMGAPFNKPYAQWSIGEYPGANNTQNDLSIVASALNYLADEAGGTKAAAATLSLPVSGLIRNIAPAGHLDDTDVFRFTTAGPGTVDVSVTPWLGHEGEARAGNVAINARLEDATGAVIASTTSASVVPLAPNTNKLTFSGALAAGDYYLFVDGVSPNPNWSTGFGEYGNGGRYVLDVSVSGVQPPGAATLIAPNGNISETSPAYSWNAVPSATWYQLYISNPGGDWSQWLTAADVGCASGTGVCSQTPALVLQVGGHNWWVRTYSDAGYGPWSNAMAFAVQGAAPTAAAIVTPKDGQTVTTSPGTTFTWSAVPDSTWYALWVQDLTGVVVNTQWYTSAEANCTTTCSVTIGDTAASAPAGRASPSLSAAPVVGSAPLADGPGTWWVLTWNDIGTGPWSEPSYYNRSAGGLLPAMMSPSAGSSITGASVAFDWSGNSTTVTDYWLSAGATKGGSNYYDGSQGTATTGTITGLPADGSPVYVRLWWLSSGVWAYADYVYQSN